jgi:hypothetical protein
LETAVLFLSLALTVNLAVYGWLGALGVWSSKESNQNERLVYIFIAGIFTVMAASSLVRPRVRGSPVRLTQPLCPAFLFVQCRYPSHP